MRTRPIEIADRDEWVRMRTALWPAASDTHGTDVDAFLWGCSLTIDEAFLCESGDGRIIGFLELRIRNYAEGSESVNVPFVEGWYVDPEERRRGAGAKLIAHAEGWARGRGYEELASDAQLTNTNGRAAHGALGFQETERTVCFLKKLATA